MTCKRNKAFLGAAIGAVSSIVGGLIQSSNQKKQLKKQLREKAEQDGYTSASNLTQSYSNQDYVDEYNKKITLKAGGKVKMNKYNNKVTYNNRFRCGGRSKKARLGTNINTDTIPNNNYIDTGNSLITNTKTYADLDKFRYGTKKKKC